MVPERAAAVGAVRPAGAPLITHVGTAAGSECSGLLTKTAVDPMALTVDRPT